MTKVEWPDFFGMLIGARTLDAFTAEPYREEALFEQFAFANDCTIYIPGDEQAPPQPEEYHWQMAGSTVH